MVLEVKPLAVQLLRAVKNWDGDDFFNGSQALIVGALVAGKKKSMEHNVNNLCKHNMLRLLVCPLDVEAKNISHAFSRVFFISI